MSEALWLSCRAGRSNRRKGVRRFFRSPFGQPGAGVAPAERAPPDKGFAQDKFDRIRSACAPFVAKEDGLRLDPGKGHAVLDHGGHPEFAFQTCEFADALTRDDPDCEFDVLHHAVRIRCIGCTHQVAIDTFMEFAPFRGRRIIMIGDEGNAPKTSAAVRARSGIAAHAASDLPAKEDGRSRQNLTDWIRRQTQEG